MAAPRFDRSAALGARVAYQVDAADSETDIRYGRVIAAPVAKEALVAGYVYYFAEVADEDDGSKTRLFEGDDLFEVVR